MREHHIVPADVHTPVGFAAREDDAPIRFAEQRQQPVRQQETGQHVERELLLVAVLGRHIAAPGAPGVIDEREQLFAAALGDMVRQLLRETVHLALAQQVGSKIFCFGAGRCGADGVFRRRAPLAAPSDPEHTKALLRELFGCFQPNTGRSSGVMQS